MDGYFYNWTDSEGGSGDAPSWAVDIAAPGNLTVTLVVTAPAGDHGTATRTISIVPPPTVDLAASLSQVDVGIPTPFVMEVVGGVPPFSASWTASSAGANGSAGCPRDGNYSEEVTFSNPGPAWVLARVVDALGDSSGTVELLTEVVPEGSIALVTNGSVGEVGWPLGAAVDVENGAPPFQWSLSSSVSVAAGPGPFGTFPADGVYWWALPFATPGTAYLNLTAVDALGDVQTAMTVVTVEPPLAVNVTSTGRNPTAPLSIDADIAGGLPPYVYRLQLSDGEASNGSLIAPGPVAATFDPAQPGNYTVEVRVTDELGKTSIYTQYLRVVGTSSIDSPSAAAPSVVGGFVALVVGLLFVGLYAYRRFRVVAASPDTTHSSALPAVRELMKRSQIIDRETLLLLGEEAGEPSDAIEAALRTLIHSGEVTTEPGPGNDEVLRWKENAPSKVSDEAPP